MKKRIVVDVQYEEEAPPRPQNLWLRHSHGFHVCHSVEGCAKLEVPEMDNLHDLHFPSDGKPASSQEGGTKCTIYIHDKGKQKWS